MIFSDIFSKVYKYLDFFSGEFYSVYLFFFFMGLILVIKRREISLELLGLILLAILNATLFLYYYIYIYTWGIPARRFALNIPILLPFMLVALKVYLDWIKKTKINMKGIVLVFLLFIVISIFSSMSFMRIRSVLHVRDLANWINENRSSLQLPEERELTIASDSYHGITYWLKGNRVKIVRMYFLGENTPKIDICFVYNKSSSERELKPDLLFFPKGKETMFTDNLEFYLRRGIITKINTPWDHMYCLYKIDKHLNFDVIKQL